MKNWHAHKWEDFHASQIPLVCCACICVTGEECYLQSFCDVPYLSGASFYNLRQWNSFRVSSSTCVPRYLHVFVASQFVCGLVEFL
jgi:hypothetical protein